MKVIVPLEEQGGKNSRMSEHFGSAPYYAVADTGAGSFEIITNTSMHHDHGQCTPADFFAELGVSALICIGIGAGIHRPTRAASKRGTLTCGLGIGDVHPGQTDLLRDVLLGHPEL